MPIYQLHISLDSIRPLIWRRVQIRDTINLNELHQIIQVLFNWTNCHLHEFEHDGNHFGTPDPKAEYFVEEEPRYILDDFCIERQLKMSYEYDFGDGWKHTIKLEKIIKKEELIQHPICLDGARNTPPEDCGGIRGFQQLVKAMKKPKTEEYREFIQWLGKKYDMNFFDLAGVNKRLKRLKLKLSGHYSARHFI